MLFTLRVGVLAAAGHHKRAIAERLGSSGEAVNAAIERLRRVTA